MINIRLDFKEKFMYFKVANNTYTNATYEYYVSDADIEISATFKKVQSIVVTSFAPQNKAVKTATVRSSVRTVAPQAVVEFEDCGSYEFTRGENYQISLNDIKVNINGTIYTLDQAQSNGDIIYSNVVYYQTDPDSIGQSYTYKIKIDLQARLDIEYISISLNKTTAQEVKLLTIVYGEDVNNDFQYQIYLLDPDAVFL